MIGFRVVRPMNIPDIMTMHRLWNFSRGSRKEQSFMTIALRTEQSSDHARNGTCHERSVLKLFRPRLQ